MERSSVTTPLVLAACAGFLLGVLWMDLMFDAQAFGQPAVMPEPVLASIAGYYRRVTTDAAPRGALIAAVMLLAAGGALWQAVRVPGWLSAVSGLLIVLPVGLALARIVPDAVRLGTRADPAQVQSTLARSIAQGHVTCFVAVSAFLLVQLAIARRGIGVRR